MHLFSVFLTFVLAAVKHVALFCVGVAVFVVRLIVAVPLGIYTRCQERRARR
jgi:hypothetical protein